MPKPLKMGKEWNTGFVRNDLDIFRPESKIQQDSSYLINVFFC